MNVSWLQYITWYYHHYYYHRFFLWLRAFTSIIYYIILFLVRTILMIDVCMYNTQYYWLLENASNKINRKSRNIWVKCVPLQLL